MIYIILILLAPLWIPYILITSVIDGIKASQATSEKDRKKREAEQKRQYWKRKLQEEQEQQPNEGLEPSKSRRHSNRYIPSHVRKRVYERDGGKCVECGGNANIEYDHIIPVAKGGLILRETSNYSAVNVTAPNLTTSNDYLQKVLR